MTTRPDPIDRLTTAAIFLTPLLIVASTIAYSLGGGMNRSEVGGALQRTPTASSESRSSASSCRFVTACRAPPRWRSDWA